MMFVVMAYDIGEKRVAKALKTAKKYLDPVQNSLFHGFLTNKQLTRLKQDFSAFILPEEDKVIIYKTFDSSVLQTEEIGTPSPNTNIL